MPRKNLFTALAVAGLGFGLAAPAQASEELTSSMVATCVGAGGDCSMVEFVLNVTGPAPTHYVKDLVLFGSGGWEFGTVDNVWSGINPVTWSADVSADGLNVTMFNGAPYDPSPIRVRVSMTQFGNASEFADIRYTANGYTTPSGPEGFYSTQGVVTPEPVTTLLLGTGLAGLVGVGRRRKNLLTEEEDAV